MKKRQKRKVKKTEWWTINCQLLALPMAASYQPVYSVALPSPLPFHSMNLPLPLSILLFLSETPRLSLLPPMPLPIRMIRKAHPSPSLPPLPPFHFLPLVHPLSPSLMHLSKKIIHLHSLSQVHKGRRKEMHQW